MFAERFPELLLVSCAYNKLTADKTMTSKQLPHTILEYCLSGSAVLTVRGRPFPIEAGNCFAVMANTPHSLSSDHPETWESIRIELTGTQVKYLLPQTGASDSAPVFPWQGNLTIKNHFLLLQKNPDYGRLADGLSHLSVLSGLFSGLLLLNINPSRRFVIEQTNDPINDAIVYIKKNHPKPLTVVELAKFAKFNSCYFSSLFRKRTGLSPQQFLIRFRLWRTCNLLENPAFSIHAVADAVGYDVAVFSQAFRRTLGISPSAYRELPFAERQVLQKKLGVDAFVTEEDFLTLP